jgi:hypothetical protein
MRQRNIGINIHTLQGKQIGIISKTIHLMSCQVQEVSQAVQQFSSVQSRAAHITPTSIAAHITPTSICNGELQSYTNPVYPACILERRQLSSCRTSVTVFLCRLQAATVLCTLTLLPRTVTQSWGAMLQAGRSQVRVPRSHNFFFQIYLTFPEAL